MSPPRDPLENVSRLRRAADAAERADHPDLQWLALAIRDYLANAAAGWTLDRAAGIGTMQSFQHWRTRERWASREAVIRDLACRYPGTLNAKARAVARLIAEYRRRWPKGQPSVMPSEYADSARELCWLAFRQFGGLPGSVRHIARIIEAPQPFPLDMTNPGRSPTLRP